MYSAAENGHLHIVKWLRSIHCPWNTNVCYIAALYCFSHILLWARANGCPWDETVCDGAANSGDLRVLQFVRAVGCPWDAETCVSAAWIGNLTMLKWAYEQEGCSINVNRVLSAARYREHAHILKWMKQFNFDDVPDEAYIIPDDNSMSDD